MHSIFEPIFLWILSLILFGPFWLMRTAQRRLKLDRKTAATRAITATCLSLVLAVPVALLTPIWSGIHLIVYYVLSVGLTFWVFREIGAKLESAEIWGWSWQVNGVVGCISAVVWFGAFATLIAGNTTQPLNSALGPGGKSNSAALEKLETDGRLSNRWFEVPSWASGTWQLEKTISKKRSDNNAWSTHVEPLAATLSLGQAQDAFGQVWEAEQVGKRTEFESRYADSLGAKGLQFRIALIPKSATESDYAFETDAIQQEAKPHGQIIGSAQQKTNVTMHRLADNKAEVGENTAMYTSSGGLIFSQECHFVYVKTAPFASTTVEGDRGQVK